jgi:hypothetical protein
MRILQPSTGGPPNQPYVGTYTREAEGLYYQGSLHLTVDNTGLSAGQRTAAAAVF